MTSKHLEEALVGSRLPLVEILTEYVQKHGEEPTDYDINEFGLTEEDDGEGKIVSVLNLFDNGGCYFAVQRTPNDDDIDENDINTLWDGFEYYAFQCLYIVSDDEGDEYLKYYTFTNGGIVWDDDESEPDHDKAVRLPLDVLTMLIRGIVKEQG